MSSDLGSSDQENTKTVQEASEQTKHMPIPSTPLTFETMSLDTNVVEAIQSIGWKEPTEVQTLCMPHTLKGGDLAGFAQTGTGKTGVFLITVAQKIINLKKEDENIKGPLCLVMTPTRELAMQIESDARDLFKPLNISSMAVFGGIDYEKQSKQLQAGVDLVVATPGRLKDYINKKVFSPDNVKIFICDEADRMFDMGFIDDIKFFLNKIPEETQKLLFSATTNDSVKELAFEYLNKPEYIFAQPDSLTPENIDQSAIICEARDKLKVMLGLIKDHNPTCSLIFTNTKATAEWLHFKLNNNGLSVDIITGDLSQRKRISLIEKIKKGNIKALIATDVASRGLHIADLSHVYNFDLPDDPSNYVHRIGRTARAGAKGAAISLVCEDYGDNLKKINELLGEEPLAASWYDQRYADITDKAGNPFSKENQEAMDEARGVSRDKRPDRNARGPAKSGNRPEGARGKNGPNRDSRPRKDGGNRPRNQQQDRRPRNQSKPGQIGKIQPGSTQKPAAQQAAQKESVTGLFKKFIKTIFGG